MSVVLVMQLSDIMEDYLPFTFNELSKDNS
jgi:hypothetical protein